MAAGHGLSPPNLCSDTYGPVCGSNLPREQSACQGRPKPERFCLASPIRSAQEAARARSLGSTQHTQEAQCQYHTHGVHGAHGALSPVARRGGFQGGPSLAGLLGPQTVGGAVPSCTPAHGLGPREKRAGHWGRAGSLYDREWGRTGQSGGPLHGREGRLGFTCFLVHQGGLPQAPHSGL